MISNFMQKKSILIIFTFFILFFERSMSDEIFETGKKIFLEEGNCATCHTLSDAGSEGNIGPNLDTVTMTVESVTEMVTYGLGVMPAFGEDEILTKEEIDIVSKYVVSVANK